MCFKKHQKESEKTIQRIREKFANRVWYLRYIKRTLNKKKRQTPSEKLAKDLNVHFPKEDIQMVRQHKDAQHHQPLGKYNQNQNGLPLTSTKIKREMISADEQKVYKQ